MACKSGPHHFSTKRRTNTSGINFILSLEHEPPRPPLIFNVDEDVAAIVVVAVSVVQAIVVVVTVVGDATNGGKGEVTMCKRGNSEWVIGAKELSWLSLELFEGNVNICCGELEKFCTLGVILVRQRGLMLLLLLLVVVLVAVDKVTKCNAFCLILLDSGASSSFCQRGNFM